MPLGAPYFPETEKEYFVWGSTKTDSGKVDKEPWCRVTPT